MTARKRPAPEVSTEQGIPGAFLRQAQVATLLSVSVDTLRRWERAGEFPTRRRLGPGAVGWRAQDLDAWLSSRPQGFGARRSAYKVSADG